MFRYFTAKTRFMTCKITYSPKLENGARDIVEIQEIGKFESEGLANICTKWYNNNCPLVNKDNCADTDSMTYYVTMSVSTAKRFKEKSMALNTKLI